MTAISCRILGKNKEQYYKSNGYRTMNFLTRIFALHFDRSFSGKGWKQLTWLCGIILIVFLFCYLACRSYLDSETGSESFLYQVISLFIDPGSIANATGIPRWLAIVVSIVGLILFCGLLISVLSNMLERRVERYRDGDIAYPMRDHVVIIGFDDMVPTLIQQICNDEQYAGCYILVQSNQPAQEVRNKIHTELCADEEKRIVILHARRDSIEDLEKLSTTKAKEIFLIGERNEHDHDSLNIECLKKIVDIHKKQKDCPKISFTVLFEYQTTFAAFQITDLSSEWRKYIKFHPFNFYEEWAKKLLVQNHYGKGTETIIYPSLAREPITYESNKHIHLVIIGMSRMGVAIGVEAAHLLHFPNYCRDNKYKSVITFIDEMADREMNFFRGRYRHYFEISSAAYYDASNETIEKRIIPPTGFDGKDCDFLDVEFEFIKGRAESPVIQKMIQTWADSEDEILSIAICLNYPPQSMAMGLYLPDIVYEKNISVFIRQETSAALLTMLNSKKTEEEVHKYSHVYPFGMLDNCYDLDGRNIHMAQSVHYVYDYFYQHKTLPEFLPEDKVLNEYWNDIPVAHQWSNMYNAYSIKLKLHSLNLLDKKELQLDEQQVNLLAQVEHNRWNMEKLLLGYRKPTQSELRIMLSDVAKKREYKQKKFVHPDICPYDELNDDSKKYDISITKGIPLIVNHEMR